MRSILILSGLLSCSVLHAATITIRSDDWYPYNGDPMSEQPGYMIEAARVIAERNGHQIDYAQLSWEQALEATRAGSIDCVVGAYVGDAPDFEFPETSWGRSADTFFVMSDNPWRFNAVADLATQRLARIAGYEYSAEVEAYFATAAPEAIVMIDNTRNGLSKALMLLVTRRADVVVEDENVARAKIGAMGLQSRIVEAGAAPSRNDIYIACTPARPEGEAYAKMFSDGMAELRRSGELTRILARYGLRDWLSPR
jgi:polar amino acid transport system substrate-binding protein